MGEKQGSPATVAAAVGNGEGCQCCRFVERFYGLAPREYYKHRGG